MVPEETFISRGQLFNSSEHNGDTNNSDGKKMYNKKVLDIAIKATKKWSPYPNWLVFKNLNIFILLTIN